MRPRYDTLVAAARGGDASAIDDLFQHLLPRVRHAVHHSLPGGLHTRHPWLSALLGTGDLVQEICVSILRNLGNLPERGETALTRYLSALTRNRMVDVVRFHEAACRDRRRHQDAPQPLATRVFSCAADPLRYAITREQVTRVHRILRTFPDRDRRLLRARLEHDRPFEELATTLGYASTDSVRKAFHVARTRLVVRLRADVVGGRRQAAADQGREGRTPRRQRRTASCASHVRG